MMNFNERGNLQQGIHLLEWENFAQYYSWTEKRMKLIEGLKAGLYLLKYAGCQDVYIDGSFVTRKDEPGDFDACWETLNVDPIKLDPVFLDFNNGRANQKARFLGEFFFADSIADSLTGRPFLDFFQRDKHTDDFKGIIKLDIRRLS